MNDINPMLAKYLSENPISERSLQIKSPGKIPFRKETWDEFKKVLNEMLTHQALSADDIYNDIDAKNFIIQYVDENILSEKSDNERLILNINIRLAHISIDTVSGTKTFPVINEYHGHHLKSVSYFYKNKENNKINIRTIEIKNNKIIY